MTFAVLLIFALSCICWSLYVRRVTWRCRWEAAITLTISLQGAAILLMSPLASDTIGPWLHSAFGIWSLEDLAGHLICTMAGMCFIYHLICRLGDDEIFQWRWKMYVERPASVIVPMVVVAFWMSSKVRSFKHNLFAVQADGWLEIYWTLQCGFIIYMMIYAAWATLILRQDPRSRTTANIYLTASGLGVLACLVKIATAFDPNLTGEAHGIVVWLFVCLACVFYSLGSALSWIGKSRQLGIRRDRGREPIS